MTTITLREPAEAWVMAQVGAGRFPDAESYVAALVERDRVEAAEVAELRAAVERGRASGVSERTVEQVFDEAMRRRAVRG